MTKKIEETPKDFWAELWAEYKKEWKKAWEDYKTLIGPFIKGTAQYLWLLVKSLLAIVTEGLYLTGKYFVEKIIAWFKKI